MAKKKSTVELEEFLTKKMGKKKFEARWKELKDDPNVKMITRRSGLMRIFNEIKTEIVRSNEDVNGYFLGVRENNFRGRISKELYYLDESGTNMLRIPDDFEEYDPEMAPLTPITITGITTKKNVENEDENATWDELSEDTKIVSRGGGDEEEVRRFCDAVSEIDKQKFYTFIATVQNVNLVPKRDDDGQMIEDEYYPIIGNIDDGEDECNVKINMQDEETRSFIGFKAVTLQHLINMMGDDLEDNEDAMRDLLLSEDISDKEILEELEMIQDKELVYFGQASHWIGEEKSNRPWASLKNGGWVHDLYKVKTNIMTEAPEISEKPKSKPKAEKPKKEAKKAEPEPEDDEDVEEVGEEVVDKKEAASSEDLSGVEKEVYSEILNFYQNPDNESKVMQNTDLMGAFSGKVETMEVVKSYRKLCSKNICIHDPKNPTNIQLA